MVKPYNCTKCPELAKGKCDGTEINCMCKRCPRNIAECLVVKYCRETECPIYMDRE